MKEAPLPDSLVEYYLQWLECVYPTLFTKDAESDALWKEFMDLLSESSRYSRDSPVIGRLVGMLSCEGVPAEYKMRAMLLLFFPARDHDIFKRKIFMEKSVYLQAWDAGWMPECVDQETWMFAVRMLEQFALLCGEVYAFVPKDSPCRAVLRSCLDSIEALLQRLGNNLDEQCIKRLCEATPLWVEIGGNVFIPTYEGYDRIDIRDPAWNQAFEKRFRRIMQNWFKVTCSRLADDPGERSRLGRHIANTYFHEFIYPYIFDDCRLRAFGWRKTFTDRMVFFCSLPFGSETLTGSYLFNRMSNLKNAEEHLWEILNGCKRNRSVDRAQELFVRLLMERIRPFEGESFFYTEAFLDRLKGMYGEKEWFSEAWLEDQKHRIEENKQQKRDQSTQSLQRQAERDGDLHQLDRKMESLFARMARAE